MTKEEISKGFICPAITESPGMTNEEKARDIVFGWSDSVKADAADAALQMAEYKDGVVREHLEMAIEKANRYYDQKLSANMLYRYLGMVQVLSQILGIPFPSDRLHMNFITLD